MPSKMSGYTRKPVKVSRGGKKPLPKKGASGPERYGGRGAAVASKAPGRAAEARKAATSMGVRGVGMVRKPSVGGGSRPQNRVASGTYKSPGPAKQPTLRRETRKS